MISTFTITLRGAFVARLLSEMVAKLCGSMGTLMAAVYDSLKSLSSRFGILRFRSFSADLSRSMQLPLFVIRMAISQFQRPSLDVTDLGKDLPTGKGEYGVIDHIIGWNCPERRKIRSEAYWLSAIRP